MNPGMYPGAVLIANGAVVDLRNNMIERLQPNAFAGLVLSGTLDLSSNRMRAIGPGIFGDSASPCTARALDLGAGR